ncbi:MAG: AmmeMemoRadiSam system protein B [Bacteroidales bacterium]|nr:AmmeMemoRadiSam system protein B [Bacteroidales bacterium]
MKIKFSKAAIKALSLFIIIAMNNSCNGQNNQSNLSNRKPVVAGSFYPASKGELTKVLEEYFSRANKTLKNDPIALIVPHAGYVFSGQVAASAFKQLDRDKPYKHIFLIGSSHTMYFSGASIYTQGNFETPLGSVPIDSLAKELVMQNDIITDNPQPHAQEHGLEVQLPFLQYWLKKPFSIVPIIVGGESQSTPKLLAQILAPYFTSDNLFIISSDFSHYPSYNDASASDSEMEQAIVSNSATNFMAIKHKLEGSGINNLATAMCGWTSALTLLNITENISDIAYFPILYHNSGDSPYGEKDRVVGYWAIAAVKKTTDKQEFNLTDKDKIFLLSLARNSITNLLTNKEVEEPDQSELSQNLLANAGAFVTLKENGQLRGCIGNFSTNTPLYRVVMSMAKAAATEDYRFSPVTANELKNIEIEISVLTPLKKIDNISEIVLGKHGIYIKKGMHTGTFLPQVAKETGWNIEEFVGHCSRDKAFIGWDGWRNADLYTYEAIIFDENEFIK